MARGVLVAPAEIGTIRTRHVQADALNAPSIMMKSNQSNHDEIQKQPRSCDRCEGTPRDEIMSGVLLRRKTGAQADSLAQVKGKGKQRYGHRHAAVEAVMT